MDATNLALVSCRAVRGIMPRQTRYNARMSTETISPETPKFPVWLFLVLLPVFFALGLATGWAVWGASVAPVTSDTPPAAPAANSPITGSLPTPTSQVVRYDVPVDDDPFIGPDVAPITIIEFSDYECPYCKRWHDEVFLRLLDEYPDQVRIVYRDFPLDSIHPNATPAAEAANCANEQGLFWEFHNALFGGAYGLNRDAYIAYATDLGMDVDSFTTCIDERRYADEVQADFEYAAGFGIRSTPTFFINGLAIIGAQPFEVFQQVIEQELAGQIP